MRVRVCMRMCACVRVWVCFGMFLCVSVWVLWRCVGAHSVFGSRCVVVMNPLDLGTRTNGLTLVKWEEQSHRMGEQTSLPHFPLHFPILLPFLRLSASTGGTRRVDVFLLVVELL